MTCKIEGCFNPMLARGLCQKHYFHLRVHGDPRHHELKPPREPTICSVEGCERIAVAKGYCPMHYQRLKKTGHTDATVVFVSLDAPIAERFWPRVDKNGPWCATLGSRCWDWTGGVSSKGYGKLDAREDGVKRSHSAHVVSWRLHHGPIANGNHIHHRCENPKCCNPEHLQSVTPLEHRALHEPTRTL